MSTLMTRVFAFLTVLCAMFLPGLAHGQDPLVCQLAGKQAKCPGNASLPAGTITSGSLPNAGTAGTYAYPQSVTTDGKGRVTSITAGSAFTLPNVGSAGTYAYPASMTTDAQGRVTAVTAGSAFTLPDVGTPGSYQNPVSITTDAKGRVTSVTVATFSARKALYVDCTVSASGDGSLTSPL